VGLHREVASSVTRRSSCKTVVLVTLVGCHLLDGLVVVSVEARKKLVRCSGEELCEGHYARPTGAMKSNSSRARREGRQVVWPAQVLELVVSTPCGRVLLVGHH
jgi:hypothetical protein